MKAKFVIGLLLIGAISFSSCSKDNPSTTDRLVGDWEISFFSLNANVIPSSVNLQLELDDDGEFTLTLTEQGEGSLFFSGEWEVDENKQELELNYEINPSFYVGLIGNALGQSIPREEYEIDLDGDELVLDGNISGISVVMEYDRD